MLAIILFVLISELGFRLAGFKPLDRADNVLELYSEVIQHFLISDPYLGFRNRHNGRFISQAIQGKPLVTTDIFGFRNGFGWPGDSQDPIIVFIGDSVTFCAEVNDCHTGPSEVAKLLAEEFEIRVLNAAVQAYNTLQSKRMLEEVLHKFGNIRMAIYVYCENDIYENLNRLENLPAPIVQWDSLENALKIIEVEKDPLNLWGSNLLSPIALQKKNRRDASLRIRLTNILRSQSAIANQSLILLRALVSGSQNERAAIERARADHGDRIVEELLRQMKKTCADRGVTFLATAFTRQNDDANFKSRCQNAEVQFIGIGEHFREDPLSYASLRIDGQYDGHYGPKGTQAFAQGVFPTIRAILRNEGTDE